MPWACLAAGRQHELYNILEEVLTHGPEKYGGAADKFKQFHKKCIKRELCCSTFI